MKDVKDNCKSIHVEGQNITNLIYSGAEIGERSELKAQGG
jgi:hypothetical protein